MIFLPALAVGSLMACERVDPASTNKKLEQIDERLAKIEDLLQKGAAARPAAARPQRPPGPDASAVYAVPVEGSAFKGPQHAKVTVVEAFEFA